MGEVKRAARRVSELRNVAAVVVGAGQGRRMGGEDKTFLPLLGKPLLSYAVDALEACPQISEITLVVGESLADRCRRLVKRAGWRKVSDIRAGGTVRAASVRAGLAAVKGAEWVLVHDAARPLLTPTLVATGLAAATGAVAAVAAVPVRDTLKRMRPDQTVEHTVDRSQLWAAQTPQVFRREALVAAFRRAGAAADDCTDEGALLESQGIAVRLFPGDPANIKVTVPADIQVATALLRYRRETQEGHDAALE
ncbi:MAG: 2-C-methyl-D-erythritol 4-phosphate cytidylyltransferase [Dehalococcoidia bacterium]|nr:2-C-methyl-D-erythritol 4-phosphate cytidylyltransferase [Dehalococcoidia bacterium]